MSDSLNNEQRQLLLTAYVDNELGPEDRMRVELMLAENPTDAQMLQQWRENGDAIRDLPRYSLDDGFAARVLAATEISSDQHHANATISKDQPDSDTNSWRIGFGAIATLAAMLLLTLFVFPAMIDSNVAVHQPEKSGSGEVVSPEGTKNDVDPGGGGLEKRQPVIGTRNSSLPGGSKNGRPVDPIALKSFTGPNIEQVLWIEDKSLADLETVLANHSIRLVDPDGDIQNQAHLVPQSTNGVEALYVVSSIARMKQAIAELSRESTCTVKAFPLPSGSSSSAVMATDKANNENGSAQQITPFDLSQKGTDASEIASLDKWFGLAEDDDESRIIQFLLLVNSSRESASNAPADASNPVPADR